MTTQTRRRLILIDPSLEDFRGHYHQYACHVLRAARQAGFQPLLAANRRFPASAQSEFPVYPLYQYGLWTRPFDPGRTRLVSGILARTRAKELVRKAVGPALIWQRRLADRVRVRQFARDTADLLRQTSAGADDLVFFPTMGQADLEGLLRTIQQIPDDRQPQWHLVFRYDPPSPVKNRRLADLLARTFARAGRMQCNRRLHFFTDTDELSDLYRQSSGLPFATLPIPHTDGPSPSRPSGGGPLRIVYLGGARKEKGFHHLPNIVRQVREDLLAAGQAAFTVQSAGNLTLEEPEIIAARKDLQTLAGQGVTLLGEALTPEQYRGLLHSGDLALLPYDRQAYRARSSGILAEVLAAGIPAIVPAGTWLARQLPAALPGSTPVGLTYEDVGEVPQLLREMVRHHAAYRDAARALAPRWMERHNAARLIEMLTAAM
jgi:hypothetical protein